MWPLFVSFFFVLFCLVGAIVFAYRKDLVLTCVFGVYVPAFAGLAVWASTVLNAGVIPKLDLNNDLLTVGLRYETLADVQADKSYVELIRRPDGSVVSYHTSTELPLKFVYTPEGKQKFTPVE